MSTDRLKPGPDIIERNGALWLVGIPKEGPQGPFDKIFFRGNQSHLVGRVPASGEINSPRSENHVFLGLEYSDANVAMQRVSTIVNSKSFSQDLPDHKFIYQEAIIPAVRRVVGELHGQLSDRGVLENKNFSIYAPLNGGEFMVAALIYCAGEMGWKVPWERFACFELKRSLMGNGDLYLGARFGYMPEGNIDTVNVVLDDCVASDASAGASLEVARGQFSKDEVKQPIVAVTGASCVGIRGLQKEHNAMVVFADQILELNDHLYLMRTDDEGYKPGDYAVGDMGTWLGRLPFKYYNEDAPWNAVRRDLVDYWEDNKCYPLLRS